MNIKNKNILALNSLDPYTPEGYILCLTFYLPISVKNYLITFTIFFFFFLEIIEFHFYLQKK